MLEKGEELWSDVCASIWFNRYPALRTCKMEKLVLTIRNIRNCAIVFLRQHGVKSTLTLWVEDKPGVQNTMEMTKQQQRIKNHYACMQLRWTNSNEPHTRLPTISAIQLLIQYVAKDSISLFTKKIGVIIGIRRHK